MNSQAYQTGKLVPIDLPEICAPRLGLMGLFQKASGRRCVFVSAPAGSGKTVSTLLWLQKSGRRALWLSLDPYDNSLTEFYRMFLSAIFSAAPQAEGLMDLVKSPAFGASPIEHTIEALTRIHFDEGPYALVLDDFHLITNEEILKSLYYVLQRLPLSFTVLVLSRGALPWAFQGFQAAGQLALLSEDDLAFSSEEIRRHFAGFGHFLTGEEAQSAHRATEGWAIAVSALAMSGSVSAGDAAGGALRGFIETQVWEKLGSGLRLFMMQTAVVERFSAELARRLTGRSDSRQILQRLLGENLFLSHREGEFRYHRLFLAFLREEFQKAAETGRQGLHDWAGIDPQGLHRRAAEYYEQAEDFLSALYHFLQCDEAGGVAAALGRFLTAHVDSSSDVLALSYLGKLPQETFGRHPCLHIGCAWQAFFFGEAREVFRHLDALYGRIGEILALTPGLLEPALLLYINDPRHTFSEQLERLRAAAVLPGASPAGIPKILASKLPYFLRIYRDFSHYARDPEKSFSEFRGVFSPVFGGGYAILEAGMRSWLLYNQNRISAALALVSGEPETPSPELVFLSRLQIATCLRAAGQDAEAARYEKALGVLVKSQGLLHLLPILASYETKLRLLDGDKTAAKAWFEQYFVSESAAPQLYKLFLHPTTVRAYIVSGDLEKAKDLCLRLRALCADYRRVLDIAEAQVLLCVLLWLEGRRQEAEALLRQTLDEMRPLGYIRVFADEGKALLPPLKRLIKRQDAQAEPGESAFARAVYLAVYEQSRRRRGIAAESEMKPVKLSRQQKLVLELLAKGYRNARIVEATGLSINTVRYHTKLVYQKLGVNSAADAVLRARELGLIN